MFLPNRNVAKKLSSNWNYAVNFPSFTLWYWQWNPAENQVHSVEVFQYWHSRMLALPELLLLKFYLRMANFEVWECWLLQLKAYIPFWVTDVSWLQLNSLISVLDRANNYWWPRTEGFPRTQGLQCKDQLSPGILKVEVLESSQFQMVLKLC